MSRLFCKMLQNLNTLGVWGPSDGSVGTKWLTWWMYGNHMIDVCELNGGSIGTKWWKYGNQMVEVWEPNGGRMGTKWWRYEDQMMEVWEPKKHETRF